MRHVSVLGAPSELHSFDSTIGSGDHSIFQGEVSTFASHHVLAYLENKKVREQGPLFFFNACQIW